MIYIKDISYVFLIHNSMLLPRFVCLPFLKHVSDTTLRVHLQFSCFWCSMYTKGSM